MQEVSEKGEPHISDVNFSIHKFSKRTKPSNTKNIVIFSCFSEFGTEVLGTLYCLPTLLQTRYVGKYSIAVGWKGRAYLYQNIVDEFWEIDEKYMWLREYCRAFHHCSRNLTHIEKDLAENGRLVGALEIGEIAVYPKLLMCLIKGCGGEMDYQEDRQQCKKCQCVFPKMGIFYDPVRAKQSAVWPKISESKINEMAKLVKGRCVGITARNRACYGRNLTSIFYERLIYMLEDMGYTPIWLGEKQSSLPCPIPRILDFSSMPESNDLENTLALVSHLNFTVQYWTASTRLAGMVGTPFILLESPDQIYGGSMTPGHEGFRLTLCTKGNKKIVLAHYNTMAKNHNLALYLTSQAVREIENNNFKVIKNKESWDF